MIIITVCREDYVLFFKAYHLPLNVLGACGTFSAVVLAAPRACVVRCNLLCLTVAPFCCMGSSCKENLSQTEPVVQRLRPQRRDPPQICGEGMHSVWDSLILRGLGDSRWAFKIPAPSQGVADSGDAALVRQ